MKNETHELNYNGQIYWWDGTEGLLTLWRSNCAECGEPFTARTPMVVTATPSRRCPKHRRKGVPVRSLHPAARSV